MSVELVIPEVGESITEVEIGRWLKNEGDAVDKDEPVVEIETDKITVELPAPAAGRIAAIKKKQGDPATVGDVIGLLEEGAAGSAPKAAGDGVVASATTSESKSKAKSQPKSDEPRIMPAAQRLIDEHGLDPAQITGTGPGGRILKEDAQKHLDNKPKPGMPTSVGTPGKPEKSAPITPAPSVGNAAGASGGAREEQLVPMTPLRRKIAKALVDAQSTAALLTTFNEVDMSAVMALRSKFKDEFEKRHGVKLGFMSFFTKAVIDALKQFPAVNAEVRGADVIYKNYYDIGIAIGSGKGLVVPVLRDADRMSFADIEKAIADFAEKAKTNKLTLEDLSGGTFTITNGGIFGSLLSTPIVNAPQSGILGMHSIQQRPVAIDGQVVIRPMMYVALTYDHRLVDGREAVTFLVRIKQAIEDPARMLMEV